MYIINMYMLFFRYLHELLYVKLILSVLIFDIAKGEISCGGLRSQYVFKGNRVWEIPR